jgi:hypothetical protein
MNRFIKKFVAIATVFTVFSMVGGPALAATVEELQAQINQLLATLTNLQAQLALLQGGGTGTVSCTITSFDRNLQQTMTGDDVKCLQIILNSSTDTQVASSGAGSSGSETTYFGALTKAAVILFQQKYTSEILTPLGLTAGTGFVGAATRAKLNTMIGVVPPPTGCTSNAQCSAGQICTAGTCVTVPVGNPMSVNLAIDTPAAANVWQGSANNVVTKLTFYGGSTASTITGLTLTNYGTTQTSGATDLTAIKILDEFNVQLGTDKTMAGNKTVFVIVPGITVPANGTRTLSVAVNVGASSVSTVMAMIKLGLASATDISGTTFTGTFPMAGNSFTIVPAGSIGSITVAQFGSLPLTTARVGQKDVVLEKFNVSAGSNEDVALNQFTIKNSSDATISDSDITNIRVREVGGAVIAGPGNLSSKKVTLNLASPLSMTKGTSKNFEVIADIVSGPTASATRTVYLWLDTGAVVGQGKLSGVNMTSTGTTTANPVTLSVGAVTVSMSSNHPQGGNALIIKTTNKKTLAAFSVKAIGENITFSTIKLNFAGGTPIDTTNDITNVGLYVDDALISDLITVDSEVADAEAFAVNWTLPADTTKDVLVKGTTSTMSFTASCTVTTTWSYYSGSGLSSGETITSGTNVASTALTVYDSGKVTVAADTTKTPVSQGILAPLNNVTLGVVKVYAQREDQKLTNLVVTVSGAGYNDENDISSLTLYDAAGTTQLSNPLTYCTTCADDTSDTFTFASTDFLDQIIFTKGVYKSFVIKGNIADGADGTTAFYATILNATGQFETEGLDSGTAYDWGIDAAVTAALTLKFSSPYDGGTFSFDTHILEVKKAADSPSGTVARGSAKTYAIWDLNNLSSDQAAFDIDIVKFTTKSGFAAALSLDDGDPEELYFKLYDGNGNLLSSGTSEVDLAASTVTFNHTNMLTVDADSPAQLRLVIDTTSTTDWPTATQMEWTIAAVGDLSSTVGVAGYGGNVWSIPADTNIVTLP